MVATIHITELGNNAIRTFSVDTIALERVYRMLFSPDQEINYLGTMLFYEICPLWEKDIFPEYNMQDCERAKARARIFSRRYLKIELDERREVGGNDIKL